MTGRLSTRRRGWAGLAFAQHSPTFAQVLFHKAAQLEQIRRAHELHSSALTDSRHLSAIRFRSGEHLGFIGITAKPKEGDVRLYKPTVTTSLKSINVKKHPHEHHQSPGIPKKRRDHRHQNTLEAATKVKHVPSSQGFTQLPLGPAS